MKFTTKINAGLASLGLLIAASADDAVKFNVPGVTPSSAPTAPAQRSGVGGSHGCRARGGSGQ